MAGALFLGYASGVVPYVAPAVHFDGSTWLECAALTTSEPE